MDGNKFEEVLKDKQKYEVNSDPNEVAAAMFEYYLPRFKVLTDKLSSKGSKRVLKALIEYPLVEDDCKFQSEIEKEVFLIGENLLLAKVMMVNQALLDHETSLETQSSSSENNDAQNQENVVNG